MIDFNVHLTAPLPPILASGRLRYTQEFGSSHRFCRKSRKVSAWALLAAAWLVTMLLYKQNWIQVYYVWVNH